MAVTNFANLTDEELTIWSRDVWKAARDSRFLERFVGTGPNSMIQRITELRSDEKGARAVITLVADLEGDGVVGDNRLEGNEEEIKSYDQVIRLDQMRHANRLEGRMADQKSVVTFRTNSRDVLGYWLGDRLDQLSFLTLSGVTYNNKTDGTTRVGSQFPLLDFAPTAADAPSANRYLVWDGGNKDFVTNTANTSLVAADTPSWDMLIQLKAHAQNNFIKPIRGEMGMELYHVFISPDGMAKLKLDTNFLNALKDAMPRTPNNPLFKGSGTYFVDGMAIHTFRHVYTADTWGAGAVKGQRMLLCGAQALGFADIGNPLWIEKDFDYDAQPGISVAKICGLLKPKFRSAVNGTVEDFGVVAVDTAR